MNNRQNGRRRGRNNGIVRPMGQSGGSGNRLETRVRGNASQLLEKYRQLARDAHQSGDRVAAEYYLQHADHYFRVLNDGKIRQDAMRVRQNMFDPLDEELEDENDDAETDGEDTERSNDGERRDDRRDGDRRGDRQDGDRRERDRQDGDRRERDRQDGDRRERDRQDGDRRERDRQDERPRRDGERDGRWARDDGRRQDRRDEGRRDDRPAERVNGDARRDGDRPRYEARRDEPRRDDGNRRYEDRPREAGQRDERRADDRPREERPRRDERRDEQPRRDERPAPGADQMAVSDGEAALVAFAPVRPRRPRAEPGVPDAGVEAAPALPPVELAAGEADEAPAPRRRGRPRKVAAPSPSAEG